MPWWLYCNKGELSCLGCGRELLSLQNVFERKGLYAVGEIGIQRGRFVRSRLGGALRIQPRGFIQAVTVGSGGGVTHIVQNLPAMEFAASMLLS